MDQSVGLCRQDWHGVLPHIGSNRTSYDQNSEPSDQTSFLSSSQRSQKGGEGKHWSRIFWYVGVRSDSACSLLGLWAWQTSLLQTTLAGLSEWGGKKVARKNWVRRFLRKEVILAFIIFKGMHCEDGNHAQAWHTWRTFKHLELFRIVWEVNKPWLFVCRAQGDHRWTR